MSTSTKRDVIDAALGVAEDVSAGRLAPADLEAQAVQELRDLFGVVVGPDDPAWELQLVVCRGVLAVSGLPADELAEYVALARHRETDTGTG